MKSTLSPIESVIERMAKYSQLDSSGCVVWHGSRNNRGYGVIWFDGKLHLAHRVAFFLEHGRWTSAHLVTDHVCNNKACVNPAHLRELQNHENLRRAIPRGDAKLEALRARQRRANAKHRGNYRYVENGPTA